jgi:hypothetical protein
MKINSDHCETHPRLVRSPLRGWDLRRALINREGLKVALKQTIANLTLAWSAALFEAGIFDGPSPKERITYIKTKRE